MVVPNGFLDVVSLRFCTLGMQFGSAFWFCILVLHSRYHHRVIIGIAIIGTIARAM